MNGYDFHEWREFRVALAGAAAAPIGLVLFSLSTRLCRLAARFELAPAAGIGNTRVQLVEIVRNEAYRTVVGDRS